MQIELSLLSPMGDYPASDLGYLLHKHPERLHQRDLAAGRASVFFREVGPARATAVLHLDLDPVSLVRGKTDRGEGPLAHYVNDRPYVANSFLSVALARSFGQSLAGASKERQALADRPLPFEARVAPVAVAGDAALIEALFAPLGYEVKAEPVAGAGGRGLFDLQLAAELRLRELLNHLYVLVPVLDNAKHYWIDREEIAKLLDKGAGWLANHPAKELIARRALKHRRRLFGDALERLSSEEEMERDEASAEGDEAAAADEAAPATPAPGAGEAALEAPIRLHDLRLDAVAAELQAHGVDSVIDLGCGEGRLLRRLVKLRGLSRILGVDPSTVALARARDRLHLDRAGEALRARLSLAFGSLTYGDRRWRGFEAATLVEVIEHIEPERLSSLGLSLFGDAAPALVIVTTPNREHNALFEGMQEGALRHPDHRFEWTRAEFAAWCDEICETYGYAAERRPLGPEHETYGPPSQMAVFTKVGPGAAAAPAQEEARDG